MKPGRPSTLRRDVSLMLPTRVLLLLCAVATSAVISRALGPSGRGAVAVAFALSLILTQIGTLGVTSANPYFVAREPDTAARLVANSVLLALGVGAVLIAVGVGIRAVSPGSFDGVDAVNLLIALAAIPALLMAMFLQSILLGQGRTLAYNLVELALAVLTLVVIVAVEALAGLTPRSALALLAGGRVVAALAFLVIARREGARLTPDLGLARRMVGYGFRVYAATLLGFLVIRIDLILVSAYRGAEQAGYYAVAVALADALYILPSVVATNVFAHVARGAADDVSARAFRAVALLFGGVIAVSVLLAGPVIEIVYGAAFGEAAGLYRGLAPGIFALGMLTILSQHFAARGFQLEAVLVWFVGLAVNLAINFAFLPGGSTLVASIASSVAYVILLVLHVRLFARTSGGYRQLRPDVGEALALARLVRR